MRLSWSMSAAEFLKPAQKPFGPKEAIFWKNIRSLTIEDPVTVWDLPLPVFCSPQEKGEQDGRDESTSAACPTISGARQCGRVSIVPVRKMCVPGRRPPLHPNPEMARCAPPAKIRKLANPRAQLPRTYEKFAPQALNKVNARGVQYATERNNNGVDHALSVNWKPPERPMPGLVPLSIDVIGTPDQPITMENLPQGYGQPIDSYVGQWWITRLECSRDGVHRPTVAGIHGGPMGAFSICMSGGYEENEDNGDNFWFCGEGGRDLKGSMDLPKNLRTGVQTRDMVWSKGNLGLLRSRVFGSPVRVVRGYCKKNKGDSQFAPKKGYRYDGLYQVIDFQEIVGNRGFKVFRFRFERLPGQEPVPWYNGEGSCQVPANSEWTGETDGVSENMQMQWNGAAESHLAGSEWNGTGEGLPTGPEWSEAAANLLACPPVPWKAEASSLPTSTQME